MKDLKILFLFTLAIFSSCDLDEDPPFLDEEFIVTMRLLSLHLMEFMQH